MHANSLHLAERDAMHEQLTTYLDSIAKVRGTTNGILPGEVKYELSMDMLPESRSNLHRFACRDVSQGKNRFLSVISDPKRTYRRNNLASLF